MYEVIQDNRLTYFIDGLAIEPCTIYIYLISMGCNIRYVSVQG